MIENNPFHKNLISWRYQADGIALFPLREEQKTCLQSFLEDKRLRYIPILQCPLCSNEEATVIAEKDRYGIPLETVVCEMCGFVRSASQLDESSTRIFYEEYYRKIYDSDYGRESLEERYRAGAKLSIPRYLRKESVVLDLGCGGGWGLLPYHRKGYRYFGFDFTQDMIEHGRKKGLHLYYGGVGEARRMGVVCDYLILDQVLEHSRNPIEFLRSLKPLLHPYAFINIYVPSRDLLLWGELGGDTLRTLQNAHNFLFDTYTLSVVGNVAGFVVVYCAGGNMLLQYRPGKELRIEKKLSPKTRKRGQSVIRYFKYTERMLATRRRTRIDALPLRMLFYAFHPVNSVKKVAMHSWGWTI